MGNECLDKWLALVAIPFDCLLRFHLLLVDVLVVALTHSRALNCLRLNLGLGELMLPCSVLSHSLGLLGHDATCRR